MSTNFHFSLVRYFVFFAFIISPTKGFCQPNTFIKSYNSGNTGSSVREINAGKYVAAGSTDFYYSFHFMSMSAIPNTNLHLISTTQDGNLIWEKIYTNPGFRTFPTWMEKTADEGTIITGHMNKDIQWPPDSNDIFLVKTDSSGIIQWSRQFDTGKDELGYCVRPTSDGGFIVSGFHDAAPMSLTVFTYAMLIKTDANGNIMWEKKYSLAVRDLDTGESLPWVVQQTNDDGYILVGTTASNHAADVYVIRTDSNGNVLWANSYDHDNTALRFSLGLDVIETLSGEFVIAGSLDKDQTLNQYNYPYILKLSDTGLILDARFYDSAPVQVFQSGFSSVQQTVDGGFFFTGMGGYGGFGMQAQLLKTDANLNMQWSRSYSNDGNATIGSKSGRQTADGCYIFTGKKMNTGTIVWKSDMFGMIPCKNPGTLVELNPSIIRVAHFPTTTSGIASSSPTFLSLPALADTSTVCPLTTALLPVNLSSFTATLTKEKEVEIEWITSSESNSDYFEIEKSTDAKFFTLVGKVDAAGNSSEKKFYRILDLPQASSSILYYRLSQTDFDGARYVTKPIPVRLLNEQNNLNCELLNVSNQSISVIVNSATKSVCHFVLFNAIGQICNREMQTILPGKQQISISNTYQSSGILFLKVYDADQSVVLKISN